MAEKIFKTRIKQRRDTSANWESKNPVLLNGEVIIVDTANGETRMKTGDGTKTYTQLPFDDEGSKGGKSLIDKSFADNVSTSGNTTTIDKQLKTYSVTTRLEADVVITGLDENGQEVTKHKLSEKANSSDVLEKTNTTEFTPTADYQPATKKYVDDSVFSVGNGDMLKSVYDKDNDGIIDDVALLQYYGTTDIAISDSSYFTVNETGETITGLTDTGKTQTELVIPYEINGVKITTLFSGSDGISRPPVSILNGNSTITKVVIPKSVTTLGGAAFANCKLSSINIPNSVTNIGVKVFRNCSLLTSVYIPNNVTSIGDYAFEGCDRLTSINLSNSVTSIGDSAFFECNNLKIYCEQGSYAETFAKGKSIPVVYTDIKATALDNKVDKVEGKSLIDTEVANNISYASNSGFKLGNRWSFGVAEMTHTSPAGGAMDLKFAIDSGLMLTTAADSGDFDITLVKGSKTHKLSEKLSTTCIAEGETTGTIKIGRTGSQAAEGPFSTIMGFGGHTSNDALGSVAIGNGECLAAYTVAMGLTVANGENQLVFGKYNVKDTENKYACIIGNGTSDTERSNAHTVDWNGNAWFAGDVEGVKNGTTHKLSEKVSFGDNYNTSAAGASDVPITLHGITEGASNSNKPIGIKFNPGAGGGSTASIIVGCDNSTDTATLSYNGLSIKSTAQYSAPDVRLTPLGLQTVNGSDMTQVKAGSVKCSVDNGNTWHELSEKAEAKTYTVSVPTTSWTEKTDTDNQKYYYKKITVSGMTASGQAMTDVAMSDSVATARKEMEAYQCVNRVVTGAGYVELYCFDEVPTTAFTLRILVISNILS